jgi:hypothetical protein
MLVLTVAVVMALTAAPAFGQESCAGQQFASGQAHTHC